MNYMKQVLEEVKAERGRQTEKWGVQSRSLPEWVAILTEEVGEVAKEAIDFHFAVGDINPNLKAGDSLQNQRLLNYRMECIQVAAVAVQMVEALDTQFNLKP